MYNNNMKSFFEGFGINMAWVLIIAGLGLFYTVFQILDVQMNRTVEQMVRWAPVYLPVVTAVLFYEFWLEYVRMDYDMKQGRTTIEIKLPQDVFKSPEAMELVLIQMHQAANPDNHIQTYWDGKKPPTFSLEIASRGGDVRFYINTPAKKFKNLIETQLYAQHPGIEVRELEIDYTAEVPWDPSRFSYFSIHFGLKKADALPIKTYIEYGLDKLPKEEEKIDPITSLLETMGNIKPGEFMWAQILISANRETNFKTGTFFTHPDWKDAAKKEIKKIIDNTKERTGSEFANLQNLTETEKDTIKAIERSLGKNAFNTVIRGMYIGTNEAFNPGERIGALITGWRSYDDLNRNAIGLRWRTDFDWPWWQDRKGKRVLYYKKKELNEYKRRAYTHRNAIDTPKVMTTEELATIFHLPGKVSLTPSLARIPSKRAEPPANLPVG